MQQVTCEAQTLGTYADKVLLRGDGLFQSKAMRDNVVTLLKQKGHDVSRSAICNQLLHPEYVTDYVGTYNTGFGNTDYNTRFSVLYEVRVTS